MNTVSKRRLLIVAHCPSPHTRRLAEAALRGARSPELTAVETVFSQPLETGPEAVRGAAGIILGTTENFGYMSGAMKDFFDRIYYPCLEQTEGLPWALYVRAGNDGRGARDSIGRIVQGLRWRQIQEPLILRGKWDDAWVQTVEELGLTVAAGLEAGVF